MMKRILFPVIIILSVFILSSCEGNNSITNNKPSNIETNENSTTQMNCETNELSYLNLVDPYNPRYQYDNFFYDDCYLRTGSDLEKNYNGDYKVKSDYLYLFNPQTNNVEKLYTDYKIVETNSQVLPFSIQEEGVYVIKDRTELVLLDEKGSISKTIFISSNKNDIKDFIIDDDYLWIACGDSIIRVHKKTQEMITVKSGIEQNLFCMFLSPISTDEIEWQEYNTLFWDLAENQGFKMNTPLTINQLDEFNSFLAENSDKAVYTAKYYNILSNEQVSKDIYPLSETKQIGKGWWIVPENSYSGFELFNYTLPKYFVESGYNYDITAGCGKYITDYSKNSGNPVGFVAVDYGITFDNTKNEIKTSLISDYNEISKLQKKSDYVYTAKISLLNYEMNDKPQTYNVAFVIVKGKPTFVLCLRSDLFDLNVFKEIYDTITF